MKSPPFYTWIFGNPLIASAALIGSLWEVHLALDDTVSWLVVILALIGAGFCAQQNAKLDRYLVWKREWKTMSGGATGRSLNVLPKLTAALIWLAGAYVSLQPNIPTIVAGWYWLVSIAVLIFIPIRMLMRRLKGRRPKVVTVQVCVAKPGASPDARELAAAVPAYCHPLLFARGGPPSR